MLNLLITSKTRIKLLLKFFLNAESETYLRAVSEELGESTNAVRIELNRLKKAGLLKTYSKGRTKVYKANREHPLFHDIHNIVKKYIGLDKIVEFILSKLGEIDLAFITGDYAKGIDSGIIDLVIIGRIDKTYLQHLVDKAESLINRKIRILVLTQKEFNTLEEKLDINQALILWNPNSK